MTRVLLVLVGEPRIHYGKRFRQLKAIDVEADSRPAGMCIAAAEINLTLGQLQERQSWPWAFYQRHADAWALLDCSTAWAAAVAS